MISLKKFAKKVQCALLFLATLLLANVAYSNEKPPVNINEVLANIQHFYVDDINASALNYHAIESMMKQLDPYSSFLSKDDLEQLFNHANGRYTGLGIEVELREGHIVIVASLDNSPARLAGLQGGDVLLSINGSDVSQKPIKEVSKLIQQAPDSTVAITVARKGYDSPLKFDVERQKIALNSVKSSVDLKGFAYLRILSFNTKTPEEVANAIMKLTDQSGMSHLSGLLIDLRDNPGGVLDSAIAISDLFLEHGTIVSTKGRFSEANQEYHAKAGDMLEGAPIVVLINSGSASAAEILAGALKDNGRATLVGTRSYGKGSVQSLIPLGDGQTALKLTTAKYYTPSGTSIDGIGISPDIAIEQPKFTDEDKLALAKLSQGRESDPFMADFKDIQLEKAMKVLAK